MYQADGRPRRWRYFIAINGLAGILYLAQWYKKPIWTRGAQRVFGASNLCRIDAEEYARVDFSSFDACMGYYAPPERASAPVRAPVQVGPIPVTFRRSWHGRAPEWQDEAHAIMRKAAEKIHVIVLLSQGGGIDPMFAADFLKLAHFMEVVNADLTLFELAGLFHRIPLHHGQTIAAKEAAAAKNATAKSREFLAAHTLCRALRR
ncbi:hypothetical protein B0H14DRAFT_3447984 [Mycena olivaceomarginata]|nr:hypothetical protein B0H14DRAFT_3447984 [Mycena olivaceomarginata]